MAVGMTNAIAAAGGGVIEIGGVNYVPKLGPGRLLISRILINQNAANFPAQTVTLYKTVTDGEYTYGIDTRATGYVKKIDIETGLVVATSPAIGYEPYLLYLYNGSIYTFGASGTYFKRFSCANLALQATAATTTDGYTNTAQHVVGISGALIARQGAGYFRYDANTLARTGAGVAHYSGSIVIRRDTDAYAYVIGTTGTDPYDTDPYYTTIWRILVADGTAEQIIRFNSNMNWAFPVLTDRFLFVRAGGTNSLYAFPTELLQQGVANTAYLNSLGQEIQLQYWLNSLTAAGRSTEGNIPQVTIVGIYKATANTVIIRLSTDRAGTTGFFAQYDSLFILLDGNAAFPEASFSGKNLAVYAISSQDAPWRAIPQFCRGKGDFSAWNGGSPIRIILDAIDEVVGLVPEV